MKIPVRNTYHMLCYAWDRLGELDLLPVDEEDAPQDVGPLVAGVLVHAVERQVIRGLDRGYREKVLATSHPRGRILFAPTLATASNARGRLVCAVSERTPDVLHNRIVRAILLRLTGCQDLSRSLVQRLRGAAEAMVGVGDMQVTEEAFSRVQLYGNNAEYRFLLQLCELVHRCLLPAPGQPGRTRFRDFTRDEAAMGLVFEAFLRRFWELRLDGWSICKSDPSVGWHVEGPTDAVALVPGLVTDVLLRSGSRTIIVEAKFVHPSTATHFGREYFHGDHLRQIFAYLEVHDPGGRRNVEGLLLYAEAGRRLDHVFTLQAHPIRVCTLDLARPWVEIEADLVRIPCQGTMVRTV